MNKKIALLLSGAAALSLSGTAQASTSSAPEAAPATGAQSYAELLTPIPNAVEALIADDQRLQAQEGEAKVQLAYHHHHHHHHHHGYFRGYYGPGPYYYGGGYGGCYWTWGRAYWNGFRWVRPRVRVCN
jgi:hypothetical protein